jgi:phosphatidylglycerophosphate synthase
MFSKKINNRTPLDYAFAMSGIASLVCMMLAAIYPKSFPAIIGFMILGLSGVLYGLRVRQQRQEAIRRNPSLIVPRQPHPSAFYIRKLIILAAIAVLLIAFVPIVGWIVINVLISITN